MQPCSIPGKETNELPESQTIGHCGLQMRTVNTQDATFQQDTSEAKTIATRMPPPFFGFLDVARSLASTRITLGRILSNPLLRKSQGDEETQQHGNSYGPFKWSASSTGTRCYRSARCRIRPWNIGHRAVRCVARHCQTDADTLAKILCESDCF